MWRRPCRLLSYFPCALDLRGSVGFFCRGVLRLDIYFSIVLSSILSFKRSFGLTRSLFILYVHEYDRLGFGMLSVETDIVDLAPVATEKVGHHYMESVE